MSISLDAPGPSEAPGLELAHDEVRAAEAAVRHWESELALKVADAQALDSWWMVLLTNLTGTRDERVEQAVGAVTVIQKKLDAARAALERARAGKEEALELRDEALAREAERIAALEDVAMRVRAAGGADADRLLEIELELQHVSAQREASLAACSAASGVVAAANIVARRAGSAKDHARGDAMGVPLAGMMELVDIHGLRREQAEYVQRVVRLQEALREVGVAFEAGGTERPPSWLAELAWDSGGGAMDWLRANRHAAQQQSFESIADDARNLAEHLRVECVGLKKRVDELEDQREALLSRLA